MKEILKNLVKGAIEKSGLPKNSDILDIGCADIRPYSEYLIKHFVKQYKGIDINNKLLKSAEKKVENILYANVELGNVENLNFKDCEFDIIVCNNMIAYTDKKRALSEMLRVLRPNGVLISYFNNTIGYSIYKLFHPQQRNVIKEFAHSMVVIFNTWFFLVFGIKIFRATYNTKKEILKIFNESDYKHSIKLIEKYKDHIPYSVINFVIQKH